MTHMAELEPKCIRLMYKLNKYIICFSWSQSLLKFDEINISIHDKCNKCNRLVSRTIAMLKPIVGYFIHKYGSFEHQPNHFFFFLICDLAQNYFTSQNYWHAYTLICSLFAIMGINLNIFIQIPSFFLGSTYTISYVSKINNNSLIYYKN